MDSRRTTGEVARALGTTRSRVHRAVSAGVVTPEATSGGHLRFTPEDVERLRQTLGSTPAVKGLSREEKLVLAVLARHPLGLRSARAVARAAGISPTAARRALVRLEAERLVQRVRQRIVAGRVTDIDVWQANVRHPRWAGLAPIMANAAAPGSHTGPRPSSVPSRLHHLFWNTDPRNLDVHRDAAYIAARVLASNDAAAHAWAMANLPRHAFAEAARQRGLDGPRAALARNLAAGT